MTRLFRGAEYERLSCSKRALQLQVESEASSANYSIARCAGRDSKIDAGEASSLLHLPSVSRLIGNRTGHAAAKFEKDRGIDCVGTGNRPGRLCKKRHPS